MTQEVGQRIRPRSAKWYRILVYRYIRWVVDDELNAVRPGLSAISLEGPKGVEKTATARRRASTQYALDDPDILSML